MKQLYTDAHLHLTALADNAAEAILAGPACMLCSSAFTLKEWQQLCDIEAAVKSNVRILKAFGIHPQNPDIDGLEIMEKMLSGSMGENCVPDAIGEAGYDFFTKVFEAQEKQQDAVWYGQLELAEKYGKPLVVHLRHAVDRMFRDASRLKKIPSVIFHSFPGAPLEAEALRKRGINAYFSFGKPILNNRKNSIECVKKLPDEWILFETDAPFQTLKGESDTKIDDIARVFEDAAQIRGYGITVESAENQEGLQSGPEKLAAIAAANFNRAFLLDQHSSSR